MTLQEQKEAILKTNAFNLVSFDPEKRLERFAQDYEATHNRIQALCNKKSFVRKIIYGSLKIIVMHLEPK